MTQVMTSGHGGHLNTYTYTSAPHTISMGGHRKSHRSNGNPMVDRRVVRGSNYSKDNVPKWNPYFSNARSLSSDTAKLFDTEEMRYRREEFRRKLEERAKLRKEVHGISALYYSSRTAQAPHMERPSRSEILAEAPPPPQPRNRKPRPAIPASTQVYEDELAPLESLEDALVLALVGNTIREAAFEVAAEEKADCNRMQQVTMQLMEQKQNLEQENQDKLSNQGDNISRGTPEGREMSLEGEELLQATLPLDEVAEHNYKLEEQSEMS